MTTQKDGIADLSQAITMLSRETAKLRALAHSGGLGANAEAVDLISASIDDVIERVTRIEARHEYLERSANESTAVAKQMLLGHDAARTALDRSEAARTADAAAHARTLGWAKYSVAVACGIAVVAAGFAWLRPAATVYVAATPAPVRDGAAPQLIGRPTLQAAPTVMTPKDCDATVAGQPGRSAATGDYAAAFGSRAATPCR
jgi:hypothetical protein